MAKITKEMRGLFEEQTRHGKKREKFCVYLATATKDGIPNVIPIGGARLLDDGAIVFPDNYLNKTRKNIAENPEAAIVVSDEGEHDGYQFKGKIEMVTKGPIFEETKKLVEAFSQKAGINPPIVLQAAAVLKIEEVYAVKPGREARKRLL